MHISAKEQDAIKTVVRLGEQFGFGNLMSHLSSAWAAKLVEDGMEEASAIAHTGCREGYPIAMHKDLMNGGQWDQTGERYRKSTPARNQ